MLFTNAFIHAGEYRHQTGIQLKRIHSVAVNHKIAVFVEPNQHEITVLAAFQFIPNVLQGRIRQVNVIFIHTYRYENGNESELDG